MAAETFNDYTVVNPLDTKLKKDVERMRTSLLACTDENGISPKSAVQMVTALRVEHQMTRIVRYLDLMDKIEAKLYDAIEQQLDRLDPTRLSTIELLMNYQERLQDAMIQSHKLLQPYLSIDTFSALDLTITTASNATQVATTGIEILPSESRDRLRTSAKAIIMELQKEKEEAENAV